MSDLGISPDQFQEAMDEAEGILSTKFHQTLFEQIWAATDFDAFKRMMIQLNIDFQLHALEVLAQKLGLIPNLFLPDGLSRDDFLSEEDFFFKEGVRRSLAEIETAEALLKISQIHFSTDDTDIEPSAPPSEYNSVSHVIRRPDQIQTSIKTVPPNILKLDFTEIDEEPESYSLDPVKYTPGKETENPEVAPTKVRKESAVANVRKQLDDTRKAEQSSKVDESRTKKSQKNIDVESAVKVESRHKKNIKGSPKGAHIKRVEELFEDDSSLVTPTEPISSSNYSRPQTARVRDDVMKKVVTGTSKAELGISPEEIKHRQDYLRRQRDKLLQIKKEERQKQMARMEEHAKSGGRPKTGARTPQGSRPTTVILEEEEEEDKGLLYRKALAARIKSEVVERAEEE